MVFHQQLERQLRHRLHSLFDRKTSEHAEPREQFLADDVTKVTDVIGGRSEYDRDGFRDVADGRGDVCTSEVVAGEILETLDAVLLRRCENFGMSGKRTIFWWICGKVAFLTLWVELMRVSAKKCNARA